MPLLPVAFLFLFSAASSDSLVQQAAAAIRSSDYSSALSLTSEGLKTDPKDKRLLTLRAIAHQKLAQNAAALTSFHQALAADPDYLPALRGAVEIEYQDHDSHALNDIDHLLTVAPTDGTAHAMRASLAWEAHDCSAAIQHFQTATTVIEHEPAALNQYAACLAHTHQDQAALQIFEQIHRLVPEDRQPVYAIASIELRTERYREALETLTPLATSQDPDAHALLSAAYEGLNDTPHAVETLRHAIVLAPGRPDLYVQFASLAMDHGSYQVGIDMVNAGLQHLSQSAELHLARGVLLIQQGRYEDADRDFAQAALLDPRQTAGFGAQALAALQADHVDDALTAARNSVKLHPTDALSWYVLGEVLSKRGALPGTPAFTEALNAAQNAVKNKPDFPAGGDLLSRLYLLNGNTIEAIAVCRGVLAVHPQDQTALYRLLRALKMRGTKQDLAEIPAIQQRLVTVRKDAQAHETEANRYRLVEPVQALSESPSNSTPHQQ